MKDRFPLYRRTTHLIEETLTVRDREILNTFLTYCAMSSGKRRVERCKSVLLQFRDMVEKPLDKITKEDAIEFWALVNAAPHEEHTKLTIRKIVKRFLKWYYRDLDMIESLRIPSTHLVNKIRVNKSTLLKPRELQLMLHAAERLRDKVLLVLLYETAARPQEIRGLKWSDIGWDDQEVHLYSHKTKQDRDLPLRESIKHLKRWHDEWVYPDPHENDHVFPSMKGSTCDRTIPISVSYITRIIKRLAKQAGIERNVYTYLLRHTRLTEVRKAGVQGVEFRKFAGHTAGSTQEQVYVHLDNEDMKQSVLEKVYKIKEEDTTVKPYEERIALLEQTLRDVVRQVGEIRKVAEMHTV